MLLPLERRTELLFFAVFMRSKPPRPVTSLFTYAVAAALLGKNSAPPTLQDGPGRGGLVLNNEPWAVSLSAACPRTLAVKTFWLCRTSGFLVRICGSAVLRMSGFKPKGLAPFRLAGGALLSLVGK